MTSEPTSSRPERQTDTPPTATPRDTVAPGAPRFTRASAAWVATGAALLLLVLLIIFILQNTTPVEVHYLGLSGSLPLGMALLIAAVGGGLLVAVAGVARVAQLRMNARRARTGAPAG